VRDASDIVRVVGEHVALKPKGREYIGLCPFHDDKNPSMHVVPSKQIYHCFACGAGGDVFTFIQKYHSMEFPEALRYLAERGGIELEAPARGSRSDPSGPSRADIAQANEFARGFFATILRHAEHGAGARELIERRGISDEMLEQFQIGASPDRWDGLEQTVATKGLDARVFEQAGLLKKRENSPGRYDAMRNRLIFPIHDQIGRVIAFGGRRIDDDDEPKYLNSPESRLFHKSSTLYGLHQAARAIQRERTAIIVEGYTDVIACHQAGFANTVGTLGTASTNQHSAILARLCDTVVLLFDSDDAGMRAADRATEVFFAESIDVKVAALGRAKDPDELLKTENGVAQFGQTINQAPDLLSYRFARIGDRLEGAGPAAKSKAIEAELAALVELGLNRVPPIRRRMIIRSITRLAGVSETEIVRSIPAGRTHRADSVPSESAAPVVRPGATPVEQMLGCVLLEPTLLASLASDQRDLLTRDGYSSPLMNRLGCVVESIVDAGRQPDLSTLLNETDDQDLQQAAVALTQRIELETEHDSARLHRHWRECVRAADRAAVVEAKPNENPLDRLEELRRRREAHGDDFRVFPDAAAASSGAEQGRADASTGRADRSL